MKKKFSQMTFKFLTGAIYKFFSTPTPAVLFTNLHCPLVTNVSDSII